MGAFYSEQPARRPEPQGLPRSQAGLVCERCAAQGKFWLFGWPLAGSSQIGFWALPSFEEGLLSACDFGPRLADLAVETVAPDRWHRLDSPAS